MINGFVNEKWLSLVHKKCKWRIEKHLISSKYILLFKNVWLLRSLRDAIKSMSFDPENYQWCSPCSRGEGSGCSYTYTPPFQSESPWIHGRFFLSLLCLVSNCLSHVNSISTNKWYWFRFFDQHKQGKGYFFIF